MVLKAVDFMLAKVSHFPGHDLVGEGLLEFVHNAPHHLHLLADLFGVQALERALHPQVLACLELGEREPQVVKGRLQRPDLEQHRELS